MNRSGTALASAARTASVNSPDLQNPDSVGVIVVIDTTLVPGTAPSTVFTIEGLDGASGKYYTVLASVAITAVGTVILRAYPGLTAAANVDASAVVPSTWRVKAVHGNANSVTYSVGYNLVGN